MYLSDEQEDDARDEYPLRSFPCAECGEQMDVYRGQGDQMCPACKTWHNVFGQALRDDWCGNPSLYNDDISDLEGYEIQHAGE